MESENIHQDQNSQVKRKMNMIESFIDIQNKPPNLELAKFHGSCQRAYRIVSENLANVEFCNDCFLPSLTPGKVEKFKMNENIQNLAPLGLGIYMYFFFVKFVIFTLIITGFMVGIPTIYISITYNNEMRNYCKIVTSDVCTAFLKRDNDWLYSMNSDNIRYYTNILKTYEDDNLKNPIDYSFINFLTLIVIFITTNFFIVLYDANTLEIDMLNTTPTDYTLMIANIPKTKNIDEEELKEYLMLDKIRPIEINVSYKLDELRNLKEDYIRLSNIIKNCKLKKQTHHRQLFKNPIPVEQLIRDLNSIKESIKSYFIKIDNPNECFFNGVVFATFKSSFDYDYYFNSFPHSFFGNLIVLIKYIMAKYILCFCLDAKKKKNYYNKLVLQVSKAPEPTDVIWENLEVSYTSRLIRTIFVFLFTIFILCISFGIILGLNIYQTKLNDEKSTIKYGISVLISLSVVIINTIVEYSINSLTVKERKLSHSNKLLSNSIKLQAFTFVNTALIPTLVNYINGNWENKEILINNALSIFIFNALLTPGLKIVDIGYLIKLLKRYLIQKKFDINHDSILSLSQQELNELYENSLFKSDYNFAYIGKTSLITFFFLPIFPAGILISFGALLFTYFIDKYLLFHRYKKPEVLGSYIGEYYFDFFTINMFVYSIGNYVFLHDTYIDRTWSLVPIIIFGILITLPIHSFIKSFNYVGFEEKDILLKEWDEVYFTFKSDYQRCNPITRKKGNYIYLEKLLSKGYINEDEHKLFKQKIDNREDINVVEIYNLKKKNTINLLSINQPVRMDEFIYRNDIQYEMRNMNNYANGNGFFGGYYSGNNGVPNYNQFQYENIKFKDPNIITDNQVYRYE